MAEQEKCACPTRAATKKATAMAPVEEQPVPMKRVVLGKLPNSSNVVVPVNKSARDLHRKQKAIVVKKDESPKEDVVDSKRIPLPNYIEKVQKDITPNMRGLLVDWLVEVVKFEANMLKSLSFELGSPTVKTFLRRSIRVAQDDYKVRFHF
ncbi:hypothetical protein GH714_012260 [Hevea brasiliensis]|uniref:B-like cyclin n=1 Tax=Hevea brasiliensis TaxID=3981 RepID=A0A6A6NGN7_HEVBR|nr:hypothetical protein GH714_012260 [Hevea brasiliensis]